MDPQSQSFTPYSHTTTPNDNWRIQNDVARIQQVQAEHADRLLRLERRQDDDARMKSVWGNSSPFPSVLSGTPQQAALQQPPGDAFRNFDDEATNLMSSLHLDAEEEPRRGMGATSRANSVRFDESANQNHFSHSSRPSADFLSRSSSGLGGLQMTERTSSHKSDGRASSVHSIRSAASGRANSLNLDTVAYGLSDSHRSPSEPPSIAPGLMLLGAAPAIIRCWMNTNFKHDALLYAAVCTGSYKSFLDLRLIAKLGFESTIRASDEGHRTVELSIFFPEAVPHPASSRSGSPAPQLPSLLVEFCVIERTDMEDSKAIQIFLGSDVLRQHNADIMFSSNSMTIYDNERNKLSIPLARPENEAAFNTLIVTSGASQAPPSQPVKVTNPTKDPPYLNGLGQSSSVGSISSAAASPPPGKYRPPGALAAEASNADAARAGATGSDKDSRPPSRQSSVAPRLSLSLLNTTSEREEISADSGSQTAPLRSGSGPAIWGSWRREGPASSTSQTSGLDWAGASKNRDTSYQRKETGIKVLKPKAATRTFSSTATSSTGTSSPADGKSRFFDEGRRRSITESSSSSKPAVTTAAPKENVVPAPTSAGAPKTKSNPIGGASAFSWLNSGGSK